MDVADIRLAWLNRHLDGKRGEKKRLAERCGRSESQLGALFGGRRKIGATLARELEEMLGDPPYSWESLPGVSGPELTVEERELLEAYRMIDDRGRRRLQRAARQEVEDYKEDLKSLGVSKRVGKKSTLLEQE